MSSTLIPLADEHLTLPGIEFTEVGLRIDPECDDDTLLAAFGAMEWSGTRLRWWFGDLLAEVIRRTQLGSQRFRQESDGPSDQAWVARCVAVGRSIPIERRRREVSWSHHEAVVRFDAANQDRLLALAVSESLGVRALQALIVQEIADRHPQLDLPPPPKLPEPPVDALRAVFAQVGEHGGVVWAFDGEMLPLTQAEVQAVIAERRRLAVA